MPSLETPVLTVDANTIHRIDTRNVEDLFSIWALFSRCSGSIEEGRRLENLSWRLWNRETFCCTPGEANATTPAISISQRSSEGRYIPDLSGSIDSIDEEAIESDNEESASTSAPLNMARLLVRRQNSGCNRSRGKERHITPDDLERMVITIKEKKDLEPLTMSTHSYLAPLANKITSPQITSPQLSNTATPIISAPEPEKASPAPSSPQKSPASATDEASASQASERSATSVVRGFSPSQTSSSYRSIPLISSTPASLPKSALASNTRLTAPKKHAMLALGGSSQSDNDSFKESSLESRMQLSKKNKARSNMFQLGGSSAEDENSLRDSMQRSSLRRPEQHKKQTSFKEEVATRTIEEMSDDVFDTDDDIDESAIDDDESSDWEDSMEESGKSSIDDKLSFPRVESRRNLTSCRSLITTMLHHNDRAVALQSAASKSTSALQRSRTSSPQRPSDAPSPESDESAPLTMKTRMRPAQLKQYPDKVHLGTKDKGDHGSWNQYFGQGLGEYHSKGW